MNIIKKTLGLLVAAIACLSMAFSPAFMAEDSYALDSEALMSDGLVMTDDLYEQFDGMHVSELKGDPKLEALLDDPLFLRYFEITKNGKIKKKEVSTDETDAFIAKMDANAEGINNTELAEMNANMVCMGCGVSGLGKAKVPSKYQHLNRSHCIDISYYQGKISDANWQKVKAAGVTHVILRVGYSGLESGKRNPDSVFANNINGAYKAGLKCGAYYYSTAKTTTEAKREAQYTIDLLEKYKSKIELPVAFDYETGGRLTASVMKKNGTATCKAYCDVIRGAGYTPMVYANYTTLRNYLDYKTLQSKYKIWLANYTTSGSATTYPGNYDVWQYSSSGRVNGLSGNIDINYVFGDDLGNDTLSPNAPPQYELSPASYYVKVISSVNYRTGPGTSYKKKGSYKKGKILKVVGTTEGWSKLSNDYFVSNKWIEKCDSYKVKTKTGVNYRTGPGTKYKKKGTYSKGKILTVVYRSGSWSRLSNGYYVSSKYLIRQ